MESARKRAEQFGIQAVTVEEIMGDATIDIVVNLTPVGAHYDIVRRALEAGKHVYTEKVIAENYEKAKELATLAEGKKLYLGVAPDTFLGSAIQTAHQAVLEGKIGTPTSVTMVLNRNAGLLYELLNFTTLPGAGIGFDVGIYYLTALLSILGPVEEVCGMVQTNRPVRTYMMEQNPKKGQTFEVQNENLMSASLRFANGALGTILFNGDCIFPEAPYLAIQGTEGILYLPDPNHFGGDVRYLPQAIDPLNMADKPEVLPTEFGFSLNSRGLGVAEMADAILAGRPNRTDKWLACHALEVLEGIVTSSEKKQFSQIISRFQIPEILDRKSF